MRSLIFLLVSLLVLQPLALAQEVEPIITDIIEGQTAPFSGTLLNPAAVAQMLAEKEASETECELRIEYAEDRQQAMCDLVVDSTTASLEALQERYNTIMDIKDQEIERLTEIAIEADHRDFSTVWFTGGVILGVTTAIAIAFAINEID